MYYDQLNILGMCIFFFYKKIIVFVLVQMLYVYVILNDIFRNVVQYLVKKDEMFFFLVLVLSDIGCIYNRKKYFEG